MSKRTNKTFRTDLVMPLPAGVGFRRNGKFFIFYSAALALSLWLAYQIRFDFNVPPQQGEVILRTMAWLLPIQLFWLYVFQQFQLLPAYFGVPALVRMFWALLISAGMISGIRWQYGVDAAPPRGVILLDFLLALGTLTSLFMLWRYYRHRTLPHLFGIKKPGQQNRRRVAIVGAGAAGMTLARELQVRPEFGFDPVVFFDDDRTKWNARVVEIPVAGPPELLKNGVTEAYQLDEIILSMPAAASARVKEILEIMRQSGLPYKTVPSLGELAVGKYQVTQVRPVQIEDLLGREPVQLDAEEIRDLIQGRCVMVTGAGGSIGSELCRQIARQGARKLILVERSEVQMFAVEQDLIRRGHKEIIRPLVADILDDARMRAIFSQHSPELVYHAAAHKHVPMMEQQPGEAIRNNVFGTNSLAELSLEFGVNRFVLISTDKAINPTSVMGATKRCAETILQAISARKNCRTRFMAVRFGNVLGSSGSVIPLFKEQISAGGPVTVTHPEMTRYFMTIPEAVGLVLQSSVMGLRGEIFVLEMGKPVRILDLATQMIKLSGLEPGSDIPIVFTGIRPGEKLFEEISYSAESVTPTEHPKVMRLRGLPPDLDSLKDLLAIFEAEIHRADPEQLKQLLQLAVPEYRYSVSQKKVRQLQVS